MARSPEAELETSASRSRCSRARRTAIGIRLSHTLTGILVLSVPTLTGADLFNTASVSYSDANGSHTVNSNTVTVPVVVGSSPLPALPPPSVVRLPSVATLQDSLTISDYADSQATFQWTFTFVGATASARFGAPPAGTIAASFRSGAATGSLSSHLSELGSYDVTVEAFDGDRHSDPSSPFRITLVEANLKNIRVYPNPWRQDKGYAAFVTFNHLPQNAHIKLFTVSGRLVKDLGIFSGNARWNLDTDAGDPVASGLYLYLITDDQGDQIRGKLALIR